MIRFSQDRAGTMWTTDLREGFVRLGGPGESPTSPRPGFGHVLIHDWNDVMWVGTRGQGLWRVRSGSSDSQSLVQQITVTDGLSSNIIRSVFEDRDGNVWVGTESGLHRFTERKTTPLTDIGFSWATQTTPDGSVWIGTTDGLVELDGPARRRYGPDDGLPSAFVRALFTDATGTLWVATDRGVARSRAGRFEPIPIADFQLPRVISLAADATGAVWLAERELGVFRWSDGRLTPVAPPATIEGANANFVMSTAATVSGLATRAPP
jgi:ligand-binding sensor domain-containing protein